MMIDGNLMLLMMVDGSAGRGVDASDVYSLIQAQMIGAATVIILGAIGFVWTHQKRQGSDDRRHRDMERWIITLNNATLRSVETDEAIKDHATSSRDFISEVRRDIRDAAEHRGHVSEQLQKLQGVIRDHSSNIGDLMGEVQAAIERANGAGD